ncbi:MAG: hypothetical protein QOF30_3440, partial [Acidimicrobiaceae bacterium]|nr:hypothetical protein [Acidimicrobiaceae bacterium]
MIPCPRCGSNVSPDDIACWYCRLELRRQLPSEPSPPAQWSATAAEDVLDLTIPRTTARHLGAPPDSNPPMPSAPTQTPPADRSLAQRPPAPPPPPPEQRPPAPLSASQRLSAVDEVGGGGFQPAHRARPLPFSYRRSALVGRAEGSALPSPALGPINPPRRLWFVVAIMAGMGLLTLIPVFTGVVAAMRAMGDGGLGGALALFFLVILAIPAAFGVACVLLAVALSRGDRVARVLSVALSATIGVAVLFSASLTPAWLVVLSGCAATIGFLTLDVSVRDYFHGPGARGRAEPEFVVAARTLLIVLATCIGLVGVMYLPLGTIGGRFALIGLVMLAVATAVVVMSRRVGQGDPNARTVVTAVMAIYGLLSFVDGHNELSVLLPLGLAAAVVGFLWLPESSKSFFVNNDGGRDARAWTPGPLDLADFLARLGAGVRGLPQPPTATISRPPGLTAPPVVGSVGRDQVDRSWVAPSQAALADDPSPSWSGPPSSVDPVEGLSFYSKPPIPRNADWNENGPISPGIVTAGVLFSLLLMIDVAFMPILRLSSHGIGPLWRFSVTKSTITGWQTVSRYHVHVTGYLIDGTACVTAAALTLIAMLAVLAYPTRRGTAAFAVLTALVAGATGL